MEKTTPFHGERPERHSHAALPRHWITLPLPIRRRALTDPLLAGLFPSHVGYFRRASTHSIERRPGIDSHVFNYCVSGSGWCRLGDKSFAVTEGDLMVAPAGVPHAYGANPKDPWTIHWFHAAGEHVSQFMKLLGASVEEPVVHVGRSAEVEELFCTVREALEDDYTESSLLHAAQALRHLLACAIRLKQRRTQGGDARHRVQLTLEHMTQHLGSPLSVPDLAARAKLSPSHYSVLVRAMTGYPPKEHLMRLRMHRAAQLLDTTALSVKEIAVRVGYPDPLHFSRVFRGVNERSPAQFRMRAR